ncbi:MAG: hypothetical protein WAT17_04395 [Candidatus Saccharimonadales bacterium]|jgi:hypothetical protein
MQSYTLEQTLGSLETLNKSEQPFSYRVEGNQIIGEWKYLDATWAAPLAAGNIDKEFRVTVTLDEATHTFTSKDHQSQSNSGISFNPLSGQVTFGTKSEGFSGHMVKKEFGFGLGSAHQKQNQTTVGGPTYQFKFNSSEIKEPLFNYLTQAGWRPGKTGFLSKIFGS